MKQLLLKVFRPTPLYWPAYKWITNLRRLKELVEWKKKGRPVPPPHLIKQRMLKACLKEYNLKILVETGTYYGEMVEAMKSCFEHIYSIELSEKLYRNAKDRFKKLEHVKIIQGDSGTELGALIGKLNKPTLFWLDGHYSAGETARGEKDTPIYEELNHIFNYPDMGHVIVIDDARCFGTLASYPSIDELKAFIGEKRKNLDVIIKNDSIIITPKLSQK